jgi:hypothetical protein
MQVQVQEIDQLILKSFDFPNQLTLNHLTNQRTDLKSFELPFQPSNLLTFHL